jgi:hypothetical protein
VGVDALMEHLTSFGEDADLTLIFVYIDANMFHGWSPVCGTDRVEPVWSSMLPRQGDQPLHLIYTLKWKVEQTAVYRKRLTETLKDIQTANVGEVQNVE